LLRKTSYGYTLPTEATSTTVVAKDGEEEDDDDDDDDDDDEENSVGSGVDLAKKNQERHSASRINIVLFLFGCLQRDK
jgi:hypothetical protein